jgi:hypothetical protein
VFDEFLAAGTATARTQFVRDPGRLAPVMSDYYRSTLPWEVPEGGRLVTRDARLFMRGDNKAIELVLGLEGTEQRLADKVAAFVFHGIRWVLEWEAFVNYSTDPWQLFIKQAGHSEGVFRVYVRESPVAHETARPEMKVQFMHPQDDELMWRQKSEVAASKAVLRLRFGRDSRDFRAPRGKKRAYPFGLSEKCGLNHLAFRIVWE